MMRSDELKAAFDLQAPGYDKQWARLAPVRDGLHFQLEAVFADLPADSRVLCVGSGTGAELAHLARKFPGWSFMALDPSGAMLDISRRLAESEGFASRCQFHEGYVDSLPDADRYHAATCLLVSQFIVETEARARFFSAIAGRLRPGGLLVCSDLSSDVTSREFESLRHVWMNMMSAAGVSAEALEKMKAAWAKDVAILPSSEVAAIIKSGGFEMPVQFYQAGLIHAWFARRA
jgi:tRNA (cmo5U34)-methyltransferase